jgi:DNA-binding protein H-NS
MNILEKANEIVNLRSEEKERQYGPFQEGMERAAKILSGMTGVELDASFMYKAMIALKFSRESYSHKEDNLLDAAAYIGSYNNYKEKTIK